MKEHYCTYEQSVALKRLGFDWEVHGYYYDEFPESVAEVSTPINLKPRGMASAPRLDQAAAWLLKKKGYYIELPFTAGNGVDQRDGYLYTIVGTWSYKTIPC